MSDPQAEKRIIKKTTVLTTILNAFLAIIKIVAGVYGRSTALISDAVNSIGDVATAIAAAIAAVFARKAQDDDHPYGHEKYESMASVFLGVALIVTALEIGKAAIGSIYAFLFVPGTTIAAPSAVALIAAAATIVIKETMFRFTRAAARKAASPALEAMAMDHRSDEFSAGGVIVGILGAMLGLTVLEPVASLVICLLIIRTAFLVIKTGFSQVVDQAAGPETVSRLEAIVNAHPGVVGIDEMKTRMFGLKLYVDLEIRVRNDLSVGEAHAIAEGIHDRIEAELPDVKHIMVHVNPEKLTSK
ncbi:MAG: cation diffusion facilitator family transporter [Candidatus Izemoplasmatales bacterium]